MPEIRARGRELLKNVRVDRERAAAMNFNFTIVLEPQPEGGFTVLVPALPEVVTEGDTEQEAIAMAEDAIRAVLAYRREHGLPIPKDATPTIRKVTVAA
jgi:antitoxin HicB